MQFLDPLGYDHTLTLGQEYMNPNSKLNVAPPAEFRSRYADPNSAASNGGLIGLVSGGKIKGIRYRIHEHRREKKIAQGLPAGRSSFMAEVSTTLPSFRSLWLTHDRMSITCSS